MIDSLVARAIAVRTALTESSREERDRRLGLTAMRPFIDHLDTEVLPALEDAKSRLASGSIVLTVERQYAEETQGKRPAIAIFASIGNGWPSGQYAKSDWVEILHDQRGTRVVCKAVADPDLTGTTIDDDGDPVTAAIAHAVGTLLDRAEAAPRLTGTTLRTPSRLG